MSTIVSIEAAYKEYRRVFVDFHFSKYSIDTLLRQVKTYNDRYSGYAYVVIDGNNIGSKRKRDLPSEATSLGWYPSAPMPPTLNDGASTSDAAKEVVVILEGELYADVYPNGDRRVYGPSGEVPPSPPISIASSDDGEEDNDEVKQNKANAEIVSNFAAAVIANAIDFAKAENAKIVAAAANAVANPTAVPEAAAAVPEAAADMSDEELAAVWADDMVVDAAAADATVAPAAVEQEPAAVVATVRVSVKWTDAAYEGDMTEVQNPQAELKQCCRKYSKDESLSNERVWLVNYSDGTKHYFCRCHDDHADGPTRRYFSIQAGRGGKDYKEEYAVTVLEGA